MASQKLEPFDGQISPTGALTEKLELSRLFNNEPEIEVLSPVDRYLENSNRLNKIFIDNKTQGTYTSDLGTLLLLGFVSAVESYMRGIIRGLVQFDECVQKIVASQQVSYFAAVHHEAHMLPEALLEGVSFISATNISRALKEFCGISEMSENSVPKSLEPIFEKFGHICQIRHCCVHRFGLLGATNALKLNLSPNHFEKPIRISDSALEEVSLILEKFVLSLNSYIYTDVIQRSLWMSSVIETEPKIKYKTLWNLNYESDRHRFFKYYNLFSVTKSNLKSPSVEVEYGRFSIWASESISKDKSLMGHKAKNNGKKTSVSAAVADLASSHDEHKSEETASLLQVPGVVMSDSAIAFSGLSPEDEDFLAAAAAQENPDEKPLENSPSENDLDAV